MARTHVATSIAAPIPISSAIGLARTVGRSWRAIDAGIFGLPMTAEETCHLQSANRQGHRAHGAVQGGLADLRAEERQGRQGCQLLRRGWPPLAAKPTGGGRG